MMEIVLRLLKENQNNFVSGEALAKTTGITRAGIWKQISHLRELGYTIESFPHKGYRLIDTTLALNNFEVKDGLNTTTFGQTVYHCLKVDSTNTWGRTLANQGAAEGTVIIAETQTKGRGRMGRSWISTPGLGLWFSLVLRPKIGLAQLAGITLLTAVVIAETLKETTGIQVQIKWPNDLFFAGRKLSGILAEMNGEMDLIHYLIIGIGINLNQLEQDFPPELVDKVISLKMIQGKDSSRKLLLQTFLKKFETAYLNLAQTGMLTAVQYAKEHSANLGKTVQINQGMGRILTGQAVDLDLDGSLLLKKPDGSVIKVYSGDLIETENVQ